MFKSHKIKSDRRVLQKNLVDTYGPPIFAPDFSKVAGVLCDYSATGLAAKM